MKTILGTGNTTLFISAAFASGFALGACSGPDVKLKVRILAYRPADRVRRMASHVVNREAFLIGILDDSDGKVVEVAKLVHEFTRYSTFGNVELNSTVLELKLERKPSCDETFESFVRSAPLLKAESADEESLPALQGIVFVGDSEKWKPSPAQPLKCYVLNRMGG